MGRFRMRTVVGIGRQNPVGQSSDAHRASIMWLYLLLAFLSFVMFGVLHVVSAGSAFVGYLELAGAGAIALVLLDLKMSGNVGVARTCFLLTIVALLIVMLTTGGMAGTGILWFYLFPVTAYFLAGTREGTLWMVLLFGVLFALWLLSKVADIPFEYSDVVVRQLMVTLLIVSIGLFAYQRSREQWEASARKSHQELKAYVRQMTAMHTKLDRAKSEFVTLTSHQLRTPVSAIGWFSEMLINGDAGRLSATQLDAVKGIEDANYRLRAIVDTMLTVSSLELGELYVRPEPTDIAALSRKTLKETLRQYEDKKLAVHETYAHDVPKLKIDTYITKKLLKHLFSNACKYTPPGGTVRVRIDLSTKKLSDKSTGSVRITVEDTGYGIPLDQQADVFVKMFRADNIKEKDTDGTGLSLYVVKAMTELVGGRVSFRSAENKGSVFIIELPLEGMKKQGYNQAMREMADV